MGTWLDASSGAKIIRLVTYKRDGTPVATPVSVAIAGDRAFFRTYDQAGRPAGCGATRSSRSRPRRSGGG
jgi:hypothetical protein